MSNQRICKNCSSTEFTLMASKILGMDKLIDIYLCRKCGHTLQVITVKDAQPTINNFEVDVPIPDDEFEDSVGMEPENPYDDDGGWDPSIG